MPQALIHHEDYVEVLDLAKMFFVTKCEHW